MSSDGLKSISIETPSLNTRVVSYKDGLKVVEQFWEYGQLRRREHSDELDLPDNPNGPAIEFWWPNGQKRFESFFINGIRHNSLGPARIQWSENGDVEFHQFFIDDQMLTEEEFLSRQQTKSAGKR